MEKCVEQFKQYTSNYDITNNRIRLKYKHSYRVMELSKELAYFLKLGEEDIYVASVIGLLHDFGRFEQAKKYGTFNDSKSIDHADYSVEILFNQGEIKNYVDNISLYSIIEKSIKHHNKYQIPVNQLNERELLHTKIIRDADKIDILHLTVNLKETSIIYPNEEEVSEEVNNAFLNQKTILKTTIENDNDRIIFVLALIYDIYFEESLLKIKELKIVENYFESIGSPIKLKRYFDLMLDYIDEKDRRVNYVRKKV